MTNMPKNASNGAQQDASKGWRELLKDPANMPPDLRSNESLTDEERTEIWRRRLQAAAAKAAVIAAEAVIAKRKRADDEHRKQCGFGAILAELKADPSDPAKKPVLPPQQWKYFCDQVNQVLKGRVVEREQFLFPNVFPSAKRPLGKGRPSKAAAERLQ